MEMVALVSEVNCDGHVLMRGRTLELGVLYLGSLLCPVSGCRDGLFIIVPTT